MAHSLPAKAGSPLRLILMYEQEQLAEVKKLFFKNWPLVVDLAPKDLEAAVTDMKVRQFKQGEVIIKQGDKGDSFFIILAGSASVGVRRDDEEFTVATLRQGTTFGEMSILANAPRNATVRALEASVMIEIDQEGFNSLMEKSAVFKNAMDNLYLSRGLVTHLKMTPLFATLGSQEIEELIAEARLRIYKPGESICKRGEPVQAFLLLKDGKFNVESERGSQTITVKSGEPRYYGHEGLLSGKPWNVSLKAESRVEVVEIPRERLVSLIDVHPDLKAKFAALSG